MLGHRALLGRHANILPIWLTLPYIAQDAGSVRQAAAPHLISLDS